VEVADIDDDGDLDVVTRRKTGNGTYLWRQGSAGAWTQITISTLGGEGIGVGDLDDDGSLTILINEKSATARGRRADAQSL
jgi:hypothetical protein